VNRDHLATMAEAAALTRAGRLTEATALIQRALSGRPDVEDVVPGQASRVGDLRAEEWRDDEPADDGPGDVDLDHDDHTRGRWPTKLGAGLRGLLRDRRLDAADDASGGALHADLARVAPAPGLAPTAPGSPVPRSPASGRTTEHVYRGPAGERPYALYVPTAGRGARPLIVLLHGGGQTKGEFAATTRMSAVAEAHGFLVAYPEQLTSANAMRYWNWFEPGDQQRGAGEPAVLTGIVAEIAAAHAIDTDRVYVAGFSAGGAMAAVLGAAYPDVFAAVGVHSGLARGSAHDVSSAFTAMRRAPQVAPLPHPVPVITFHGDADTTVAAENATRVVEQFTGGPVDGDTVDGDTLVERGPRRPATRTVVRRGGAVVAERWTVHGSGHAWSGGAPGGSFADPDGPDASTEMARFFAEHPRRRR
jgi:poly(hydroxyalkanoate) depolymerase family esterase